MDEEDQCNYFTHSWKFTIKRLSLVHASRDRILLEADESGGEDNGEEDEVFELKGLHQGDSSDEDNDDYEYQDDMDMEGEPAPKSKFKIPKGKKLSVSASSELSESASEDETWGRNKLAYYSSNAAQFGSDDEEANELEEQEAKRLQSKARDTMGEDDFGLGDPLESVGPKSDIE